MASRHRVDPHELRAALDSVASWLDGTGAAPPREEVAPGATVEVRVPPFAAVQCVAGPRHTRGTPPNVVETDPRTWLALATARISWPQALADGHLHASGPRTDLSSHLPLALPHSAGSTG
jgi:hypothetical protein